MNKSTHFFATCVFGWSTADSRDEAIEKLVNAFRHDIKRTLKNCLKDGVPGFYIWTTQVQAPADEPYKIEWFAPVGVDCKLTEEYAVTYVTEKKIAYGRTWEGEAKALRKEIDKRDAETAKDVEIVCGACTVAIGAHTYDDNCELDDPGNAIDAAEYIMTDR